MSAPPSTRSQWAERRLRQAIVTGELAPGERVPVERLAAEWLVSPTPLREALRTLAHDGLLVLSPQRGARVAELSPVEMRDVYEMRLLLEPHALRLSMRRRDDTWRSRVEAAWQALQQVWTSPIEPTALEPAHTEFHQSLMSMCGSETLLQTTRQLAVKSLRYRILSAQVRDDDQAYQEHRGLYEAAVGDDDGSEVVRLAAAHIGMTVLTVMGPGRLAEIVDRMTGNPSTAGLALEGLTRLLADNPAVDEGAT
ncbi:GntR family transcriptional regulator [Actinoplanes subtropicus]|uniref:GntR family transcriptional regulator n=1 Tax=Actinoplanes subtropicus TaxID=543632 RepID=UPI00146FD918|nr:GntR family transcriptional regulator [Actinoplanes subtropicus]